MSNLVTNSAALRKLLRNQCDLITRSQAFDVGMTENMLRHRLRQGGPWKVVLPGIYLSHNGELAVGQREFAAVLYAGRDSVITGPAALARIALQPPSSEIIDVLIPHHERRQSRAFVRVHRTINMPERPALIDGLRWAPPARAVADATRGLTNLDEVRAMVASAVQRRRCTIQDLAAEVRAGPKPGSGALRAVVEEVLAGVRSASEGNFRTLIKESRLPEPMFNPRLYVGSDFLAQPDAWWRDAGVAGEVDSREWHLLPEHWAKTLARHDRMCAQGILVLHFPPRRLKSDWPAVEKEIRSTLEIGRRRPPLPIRAIAAN